MAFVREDVQRVVDLINAQPGPQMHEVDAPTAREMYLAMVAALEAPAPELFRKEDLSIPGPAGPIAGRVYQAATPAGEAPVLTYFHGGGWVIGNLATHDSLCAEIARLSGHTVVAVDYRLAPEAPFPAATEDCLAAARWIAEGPGEIGHAVTGQVVAGDSAGGNLAAAVARDCWREFPLLAQWLIYPGVDMGASGGSLDEFAEGYLLTAEGMMWFMHQYQPDAGHRWASPLHAEDWEGLPPALVFTCSLDPLRDQGRAYAAELVRHGIRTIFREAKGQVHGCMNARGAVPSAQGDLEGQIADLKALMS